MSQKTLAQSFFIREGDKVLVINIPEDNRSLLGKLPKDIKIVSEFENGSGFYSNIFGNKV
ncbi:MAG: hypothetical protein KGD61_07315 [Candidatus Lokiarchaeota archaeon]|nr:hypothetical protein [Candidatus Lokiarchaeota archaeon]